jgi:U32 family peptidase
MKSDPHLGQRGEAENGAHSKLHSGPCPTPPAARPVSRGQRIPELLAPAGDRACLVAAVENGADAVYFGLRAHNARARATNFDGAELAEVMALLHRRGVRGYVALNTLVFPAELEGLEATVRQVAEAGADALIVQDLGLVRLIRGITPDIEIHASTQMSITSADGVRLARELGCQRVILARELSLAELEAVQAAAELPVEVFVHGALCVAYSGQCLTSEALGGRSANRGECAQACRMPYEIVCDGQLRDLDHVRYLLSPQDLAAYDLIPRLIELGVASLKIEGRLKTPEYVANITAHYRRAIDEAWAGRPVAFSRREVQEMELSFSRGFSHGFLDGPDHKALVRGEYSKKHGIFVGRVKSVTGARVRIELGAPVKKGDGLVFDGDEATGTPEQGGRVYSVSRPARGRLAGMAAEAEAGTEGLSAGPAELGFGARDLDLSRIRPGQNVWKTDDPELTGRLRKSFQGPPRRLLAIEMSLRAAVGEPLRLEGHTAAGFQAHVELGPPLQTAERFEAGEDLVCEHLGRLGGTVYRLGGLRTEFVGRPMVPKSQLNALRRALVERLDQVASAARGPALAAEPVLPALRAAIRADECEAATGPPALAVLCRNTAQIEAAIGCGIHTIYADYQHIASYKEAIAAARRGSAQIFLATPRVEKPGEASHFRYLARLGADGILVRNAGGLLCCAERAIPFVADFSLNAANELTVGLLKARGALRVTASYDLSLDQLDQLLAAVPRSWLEVVIHQHIPMFHMEHCVFCAFLSPGTDKTNCGRPCDHHDVQLRDRVGMEHPLKADIGCRNTLFNAVPQTAAEFLPRLLERGARHLRIEFLDDSPEAVCRTLALYTDALAGRRDGRTLWKALKAMNHYGVTRGQLAVL